jgi:hypothetical protein
LESLASKCKSLKGELFRLLARSRLGVFKAAGEVAEVGSVYVADCDSSRSAVLKVVM